MAFVLSAQSGAVQCFGAVFVFVEMCCIGSVKAQFVEVDVKFGRSLPLAPCRAGIFICKKA